VQVHKGSSIVIILCVAIFLISCSSGFIVLPLTRLVEDILCHDYYDVKTSSEPIDERLCKEDAIQKKLAYIFAIHASLYAVVGFVAAFPWGVAADKYGPPPLTTVYEYFAVHQLTCEQDWEETCSITHPIRTADRRLDTAGGRVLAGCVPHNRHLGRVRQPAHRRR
jgi:hypothetical protein